MSNRPATFHSLIQNHSLFLGGTIHVRVPDNSTIAQISFIDIGLMTGLYV